MKQKAAVALINLVDNAQIEDSHLNERFGLIMDVMVNAVEDLSLARIGCSFWIKISTWTRAISLGERMRILLPRLITTFISLLRLPDCAAIELRSGHHDCGVPDVDRCTKDSSQSLRRIAAAALDVVSTS